MTTYLVIGLKSTEVGTRTEYVPTGKLRSPERGEVGYGEMEGMFGGDKPVPETKPVLVPWFKDLPHVYGIYSYDPTEKHRDQIIKWQARIVYFEEEDIQHYEGDYEI